MTRAPRPSWSGDPGAEVDLMHMEYDAWNRLVAVHTDDGYGAPDNPLAEYEYDGLHRRIEARVESDATPDGTLDDTRHFYYSDRWQVIEERVDGRTNPTERRFIWGNRYIDGLLLRQRDTGDNGTLEEDLYPLTDANWNVTAIIDENGDVDERFQYDPYGKITVLEPDFTEDAASDDGKSDTDWETCFASYRFEPETGWMHVRYRPYHMTLGRWGARDRLGYIDHTNLYQYGRSQPILGTDWYGLKFAKVTHGATVWNGVWGFTHENWLFEWEIQVDYEVQEVEGDGLTHLEFSSDPSVSVASSGEITTGNLFDGFQRPLDTMATVVNTSRFKRGRTKNEDGNWTGPKCVECVKYDVLATAKYEGFGFNITVNMDTGELIDDIADGVSTGGPVDVEIDPTGTWPVLDNEVEVVLIRDLSGFAEVLLTVCADDNHNYTKQSFRWDGDRHDLHDPEFDKGDNSDNEDSHDF